MKYLLLLAFMYGCATGQQQKLDPLVYYKNDLCYKVDGNEYCDPTVLPAKDSYKFKFIGKDKINFFTLRTCVREIGIDENKRKHKLTFTPTDEKNKAACPAYVSAYSRKGRHATSVILFEHPPYTLSAKVSCNGKSKVYKGVSICESREGLNQSITFDREVTQGAPQVGNATRRIEDGPCPKLPTKDNKRFEYTLSNRECFNIFYDKSSEQVHMILNIGYEQWPVRE